MIEQVPFGTNDFAENPEPRVPCVLLLDTSSSMTGQPIAELNAGLGVYREELLSDSLAAKRVEVAVVTFGGEVATPVDFTTAESFNPPVLEPNADTPMGAAIHRAIEMVTDRKATYRANGIAFYRPWIFLITDGARPTSGRAPLSESSRAKRARPFRSLLSGRRGRHERAGQDRHARTPAAQRAAVPRLVPVAFSNSQQSVSRSTPGEDVPLDNPATPDGWAAV